MQIKAGDIVRHTALGLCAVKDVSLVGGLAVCLQPLSMMGMQLCWALSSFSFGFPILEFDMSKVKVVKATSPLPYILAQKSDGGWDVLAWSEKYDLEDMTVVRSFDDFNEANNFCNNGK